MLVPHSQCIRLTGSACKQKNSSSKYYFEELRQHLHIAVLKDPVSLKLFINENPLNNAIFINWQQIMGDMRSVILAYRIIYTDAFIYKSVKAKECIVRMYTYLRVMHYDRRANNLKQTHCLKGKGKTDTKLKRNICDIHMQFIQVKSWRTTFRYLALPVSFALKMNMPTERETRIFRILYLKFRRSSRILNASTSECSLFWTFSRSVSL